MSKTSVIVTLRVERGDDDGITMRLPVAMTKGETAASVWNRVRMHLYGVLSVYLTGEPPPGLFLDSLTAEDAAGSFTDAGKADALAAAQAQETPQRPATGPIAPAAAPPKPTAAEEPREEAEEAPEAQEAQERPATGSVAPAAAPPEPSPATQAEPTGSKNGASTVSRQMEPEEEPRPFASCSWCGRAFTRIEDAQEHAKTCKFRPGAKPVQAKAELPNGDPENEGLPPDELDQMEADFKAEKPSGPPSAPAVERKPTDLSAEENTQVTALIKEIKSLVKTWNGDWSVTEPVFLDHGTREAEFAYKVNDVAKLTALRDEFAAMAKRRADAMAKAASTPRKKR